MPILLQGVFIAVIAYLWGSIPSGYWMGTLLKGKDFDIRDHGSRKTGATNVRRTLGNLPALIVLLVDLSKGIGPTLLGLLVPIFQTGGWGVAIAGLAALLGHCFSIFIGFKGGRGVMTGAGSMLVISPFTFLLSALLTFPTILISGFVSLGSIVGAFVGIVCGIVFYFVGQANHGFFAAVSLPEMLFLVIGPGLVILFHYDNIGRLLTGKERSLWQKEATAQPSDSEQAKKEETTTQASDAASAKHAS